MNTHNRKLQAMKEICAVLERINNPQGLATAYGECKNSCALLKAHKIIESDWASTGMPIITALALHDAAIESLRRVKETADQQHMELCTKKHTDEARLTASNNYVNTIAIHINTLNMHKQSLRGRSAYTDLEPA